MKKYLYVLYCVVFISFFSIQGNAQKTHSYDIKRADRYYDQFDFPTALIIYEKVVDKIDNKSYLAQQIANCYRYTNRLSLSEKWYAISSQDENMDAINIFHYAQSLMTNGKYQDALSMYNKYYTISDRTEKTISQIQPKLFEPNPEFEIKLEEFNSEFSDFSPMKIKDDLYFVSNRVDDSYSQEFDVWSSRPFTQILKINLADTTKSGLEPKVYNKSVSKMYHEGPMSWDRSKNDMYITRSNYKNGRKVFKGENDEVNLKIFKLVYVPEKSDFGKILVDNINFQEDNFSICYPTISEDGNYMIFASDMPGGFGGLDLYACQNMSGIWSNPLNLGQVINSPGNEAFPFLMPDGTLYFASDGYLGLGGYDIYKSELLESGDFDKPLNLRSPVNSSFDDFGFWIEDNYSRGYFTSNRPSKFGDDDIYSFEKQAYELEAVVYDSKTEDLLIDAEVILINLENNEEIVLNTDFEGKISSEIEPFTNYSMKIAKEGYLPEETTFSTIDDNVFAKIPLVKDFGIVLEVTVIDSDTKEEIPGANLELYEILTEKEEIANTNNFGKTIFTLNQNVEYRIRASKPLTGDFVYFAVSKDFNTFDVESPASLYTIIELRKVSRTREIKIDNIYYDLGKHFIRPDAEIELNKLIKVLQDNPSMDIELSSHTDCRASKSYNAALSSRRAESAVAYLVRNGISYRRLTASGYGEVKLTNGCACEGSVKSNCSEEEHQQNRRTVFSILKFE